MAIPKDEAQVASLPIRGGTLDVCFKDKSSLKEQRESYLSQSSLFLSTKATPQPFSEFSLNLHLPNQKTCPSLPARLIQVVSFGEQPGLLIQLLHYPKEVQEEIEKAINEPETNKPESRPLSSQERQSLHEKLRKMPVGERTRLAHRADKLTRAFLIRDTEPSVILFLLKNPQISFAEVVEISKTPRLNYQSVQVLLSNKLWSQNEEIRFNLVMNPKTPLPTVLQLLPNLNMKHLRALAKNHNIKTQIKQTALRLVQQRKG